MVGECCATVRIHAGKTTADVQELQGKAKAIRLVENATGPVQRSSESAQLGAAAADMEAHTDNLQAQFPRMQEKGSTIFRRATELVGQRALRFAVVRLHTKHELGCRVEACEFLEFCRIVEDQPPNTDSTSEGNSRRLLARIGVHNVVAHVDTFQGGNYLHLSGAGAIEAAEVPFLPHLPECLHECRIGVALHGIERLHARQQPEPLIDLPPQLRRVQQRDRRVQLEFPGPCEHQLGGDHGCLAAGKLLRWNDFRTASCFDRWRRQQRLGRSGPQSCRAMCRAGHEGGVHVRGALVVMVRACKCWTGRLCAAPQLKAGDLRGRPGEELRGQRELRDGHGVRVAPLASALREALPACASHWHGGLDR
mmetsp:Transcript_157673/g.505647  ORF Transcript_157673/g.505647 Transcript_157673/m.505647 type:complete len:366 (-) Transcript_157673:920-2017(-)